MKHPTGTIWHVGRTVGRTLYQGDGPDDLVGIMDTRRLATFVVVACNHYPALVRELETRIANCPLCPPAGECPDCARSRAVIARGH